MPSFLLVLLLLLLLFTLAISGLVYFYFIHGVGENPFRQLILHSPKPIVTDKDARKKILKKGNTVPHKNDQYLICQGDVNLTLGGRKEGTISPLHLLLPFKKISSLPPASVFSLFLGIHYVGEVDEKSIARMIIDQLTDGHLEWVRLEDPYDIITLGDKEYELYSGKEAFVNQLERQFPGERKAIKEFMRLSEITTTHIPLLAMLKMIPLWLSTFLIRWGLIQWISPIFRLACSSQSTIVEQLTTNKDLQAIFSYFFYGVPPKDSSFLMTSLLVRHYQRGSWYPKGGPSEIPFCIIPVIERSGGAVLTKARVNQILVSETGKAIGVSVQKGRDGEVKIYAPIVISDAGIYNTMANLLPPQIRSKSEIQSQIDMVQHSMGSFIVFVGLRGTKEELGLTSSNYWLYPSNDLDALMTAYSDVPKEEVSNNIRMMYITFPSAKDPTYEERHPGCSCMIIITMVHYKWFEEWSEGCVNNRGADYDAFKMEIAQKILDKTLEKFPQLSDKVTIFSVKQCVSFHLHHVGQDVFCCGLLGALSGGLICACSVLGRNVFIDLLQLKKKLNRLNHKKEN
ncbi:hypothetical protein JD844_001880 [Phrynosoma platyrhinos]|uniref:L-amino-acid oxidase n=1 Tax=Phrynosoma platyrhinos TaxID=52577 RepID=A0ABQ7TB24_PHRPL|nr:hypothetical protein JD844_001880 [Phrynosoma platyrhinos]